MTSLSYTYFNCDTCDECYITTVFYNTSLAHMDWYSPGCILIWINTGVYAEKGPSEAFLWLPSMLTTPHIVNTINHADICTNMFLCSKVFIPSAVDKKKISGVQCMIEQDLSQWDKGSHLFSIISLLSKISDDEWRCQACKVFSH